MFYITLSLYDMKRVSRYTPWRSVLAARLHNAGPLSAMNGRSIELNKAKDQSSINAINQFIWKLHGFA